MVRHILVISQYFYPEEFRINDICKEWVKRGHKVTVVTGIPNYPQGRFYKGYSWCKRRKENYEGIHIIRLPLIPRGHNSLMLAFNYVSFVVSGFFWNLFTRIRADRVFIFEVSPMTQALVGVWYAKRRKIPCYIYVQDLWPENVEIVTGIHNKYLIGAIAKMVDYIYSACQGIFATSPSFQRLIEKRCRDAGKVFYLPQYAESFYRPMEREEIDCSDETISKILTDNRRKIIFTGNIGQAQGLEILPKTARRLKKSHETHVLFVIVGDGRNKESFKTQIHKLGVEDMFLLIERQPPEKIPRLLSCCDAAFLSFMNNPLFSMTIPAKLQSYMACGMPVLAAAEGETKRIVEEADCGICVPIGDEKALGKALGEMEKMDISELKQMGRKGRKYYEERFGKEMQMEKLDEIFVY